MFNLPELMRVLHERLTVDKATLEDWLHGPDKDMGSAEYKAGCVDTLQWVRERIGVIADQDDLPMTDVTALPSRPVNVPAAFVGGHVTIEWDYIPSDSGPVLFIVTMEHGSGTFWVNTTANKAVMVTHGSGRYVARVVAETIDNQVRGLASYPVGWAV